MITYRFVKYLLKNLKYQRILKKIYKDENILDNLSGLFDSQFKIDWLGRVYVVLNPNIHKGKYDSQSQIFEYGDIGLSNTAYVEKWVMERLNIAANFIQANNLFDILTYKIEKIDDYDNYLLILQPITLDDCLNYSKKFTILILSLLVIMGITLNIIY